MIYFLKSWHKDHFLPCPSRQSITPKSWNSIRYLPAKIRPLSQSLYFSIHPNCSDCWRLRLDRAWREAGTWYIARRRLHRAQLQNWACVRIWSCPLCCQCQLTSYSFWRSRSLPPSRYLRTGPMKLSFAPLPSPSQVIDETLRNVSRWYRRIERQRCRELPYWSLAASLCAISLICESHR